MTLSSLRSQIQFYALSNKKEGKKRYSFLIELLVIIATYFLAIYIWNSFIFPGYLLSGDIYVLGLFNIITWIIFYRVTIIAKIPRTRKNLHVFFEFVRISFIGLILLQLFKLIAGLHSISFLFITLYSGLNLFTVTFTRIITYKIFKTHRLNGQDLHNVIIIADWFSEKFIEKIIEEKEWGFNISKIISDSKLIRKKYNNKYQVLPGNTDLSKLLEKEIIDEVIYCKGDTDKQEIRKYVDVCNEIGVIFRMQSELSPLEDFQLQLKTLNDKSQINLIDIPSNNFALLFKQISDIYFSLTMLILLFPLFLLTGILIKLESKGPVFFIQERVGLRGRRFMLYKFRTMVTDAEKLLDSLLEKNEADGPVFKIKSDPRITRIGRFLRKTGLDELPQLYNVLKGEMSLIGPRPSLPEEVQKYERWQLRRLSVKPGITCSWQILPDRHGVKFDKWMKLDLQYIDNWSLNKDFGLFLRTIATFFTAKGH